MEAETPLTAAGQEVTEAGTPLTAAGQKETEAEKLLTVESHKETEAEMPLTAEGQKEKETGDENQTVEEAETALVTAQPSEQSVKKQARDHRAIMLARRFRKAKKPKEKKSQDNEELVNVKKELIKLQEVVQKLEQFIPTQDARPEIVTLKEVVQSLPIQVMQENLAKLQETVQHSPIKQVQDNLAKLQDTVQSMQTQFHGIFNNESGITLNAINDNIDRSRKEYAKGVKIMDAQNLEKLRYIKQLTHTLSEAHDSLREELNLRSEDVTSLHSKHEEFENQLAELRKQLVFMEQTKVGELGSSKTNTKNKEKGEKPTPITKALVNLPLHSEQITESNLEEVYRLKREKAGLYANLELEDGITKFHESVLAARESYRNKKEFNDFGVSILKKACDAALNNEPISSYNERMEWQDYGLSEKEFKEVNYRLERLIQIKPTTCYKVWWHAMCTWVGKLRDSNPNRERYECCRKANEELITWMNSFHYFGNQPPDFREKRF